MNETDQNRVKTYLETLQTEVQFVGYTQVSGSWGNKEAYSPYNCLYYIDQGEGWFTIQGKSFPAFAGDLVIIPATTLHTVSTSTISPYRKYWCHLTAKVGELHLFQLLDIPYCIHPIESTQLTTKFQNLLEAFQDQTIMAPLKLKVTVLEILMELLMQNLPNQLQLSSSKSIIKLNDVLSYIDLNLRKELRVDDLAKFAGYNPNYFISFFKSLMGVTPIYYINKMRIERAKQLLITTNMSLTEIAAEIGMETHYFSRVFKQFTDCTPKYFRNLRFLDG